MNPVVSVDWLADRLGDPQIVIVDCRFALAEPTLGQTQYAAGHIPGAHYLDLNQDLSSPVRKHGGRHPLPNPDRFAQKMVEIGVQQTTTEKAGTIVVAYDDSRLAFASRLWWLLRYFGHADVAVLDGGFQAWQATQYPVSTTAPIATPGQFTAHPGSKPMVTIEQVKAAVESGSSIIIDSRSPERYRGEQEPIDPIAGHIPTAVNYPWQTVTNEIGQIRSPQEQAERWRSLPADQEAIVYCGSGVTACVNLLSLELAGRSADQLYAGSWSDWCSYLVEIE